MGNARVRSDARRRPSRRSNSTASGTDFSYALRLDADRPLVLQGDAGYSKKSERGQASYYFSQPYFKAAGSITIDDKPARGHGPGLDGSRNGAASRSPPIKPDGTGSRCISTSGEKLMLYRLRQNDGNNDRYGNWIVARRPFHQIASTDNRA